MIKLSDAKLCIDCDEIVELRAPACPSCTCRSFLFLSQFVKTPILREEINIVRELQAALELVQGGQ